METLFVWIAWGIISVWALRTFCFSFSKEKLERLRKTSVGLTALVLVLTLLPWLPPFLGGANAVSLALDGNTLAILLFSLLHRSNCSCFNTPYFERCCFPPLATDAAFEKGRSSTRYEEEDKRGHNFSSYPYSRSIPDCIRGFGHQYNIGGLYG